MVLKNVTPAFRGLSFCCWQITILPDLPKVRIRWASPLENEKFSTTVNAYYCNTVLALPVNHWNSNLHFSIAKIWGLPHL